MMRVVLGFERELKKAHGVGAMGGSPLGEALRNVKAHIHQSMAHLSTKRNGLQAIYVRRRGGFQEYGRRHRRIFLPPSTRRVQS